MISMLMKLARQMNEAQYTQQVWRVRTGDSSEQYQSTRRPTKRSTKEES